jgi:ammonia channel protein AmtB
VSNTVGRSGIVGPSIAFGTVFGAVIAMGILACLVAAAGAEVRNGEFGFWFGLGVVPALMLGGIVGAILFGVVGVIVRSARGGWRRRP